MTATGPTGPAPSEGNIIATAAANLTSPVDLEMQESRRQAALRAARLGVPAEKAGGAAPVTAFSGDRVDTGIDAARMAKQARADAIKRDNTPAERPPVPKSVDGDAKAGGVNDRAKKEADFLRRVLPWPKTGEPGFINLHWLIPAPSDPNKLIWIGKPTRTIEEFLSLLEWVLSRPTTKDVYFCLSRQAQAKKSNRGNLAAMRHQKDALALKAIWLDIDVKPPPKGYTTLEEALDALATFVKAAGLPPPSALVGSGGGLHVYWISDKPLTPDEWRPYAEGLKAAAINFGLRCDTQCTVNAAQVLRVPGTFNHKTTPLRPAKLLGLG
jgi:hypothetical protein